MSEGELEPFRPKFGARLRRRVDFENIEAAALVLLGTTCPSFEQQ